MNINIRKKRVEFRQALLPKWYSPVFHMFMSFALPLALALLALLEIDNTSRSYLWFIIFLVYIDLSVYLLHRYPMHHLTRGFKWIYWFHTKTHHSLFSHVDNKMEGLRDIYMVLFPPSLTLFYFLIFYPLNAWIFSVIFGADVGWIYFLASVLYYFFYELCHLAGHLAENHIIRKIPWIGFMGRYHQAHHNPVVMQSRNFGIVTPLFDFIFKTSLKKF